MAAFVCALAAAAVVLLIFEARRIGRPRALTSDGPPIAGRVSIIIPARNEARAIGACVRAAVGQDHPDLTVIAIDDGSTDSTPHILAAAQAEAGGRLRVLAGRPLPPGWVGKCNACDHGASYATGDWLLFLDADTVAAPGLVRALVGFAEAHRLDALSALPRLEVVSGSERLVLPAFFRFIVNVFPAFRRFDPEGPATDALAIGQCFLFRAAAYRAIGGHTAVFDCVLEDVELARRLRDAGLRYALVQAGKLISARMYHSTAEVVEGLGKHAAAGQRLSSGRGGRIFAQLAVSTFGPPVATLAGLALFAAGDVGGPAALAAGLAAWLVMAGVAARALAATFGLSPIWAVAAPAGLALYGVIALRGLLRAALGLGVRWKDRTYAG